MPFASGARTDAIGNLFRAGDYFIDADSNVYSLPVFLGNHDMGRIGFFLQESNPDADEAELLSRDTLAHALMYFARGVPVIYYGDEQGFTGDGGDKDARQDMFPSQVASYNDDNLIGTDATTAEANFDTSHPIYQALATYADIFQNHLALRRGAQIVRYDADTPGILAFSRIERDEKVEYLVVFNNAEESVSASFDTYSQDMVFTAVYPEDNAPLTSAPDGTVTVTVPPLSFGIWQANSALKVSTAAPTINFVSPEPDAEVTRRLEVEAELGADIFAEVTFAVKVGDEEEYTVLGTDDNPPYRVYYDLFDLAVDTPLTFKAIVNDLSGNLNSTTVTAVVGEPEGPDIDSVTIASDFQSELGCPGDWQPDCEVTHLAYDAGDDVWQETFTIPTGEWEYKAAINNSWDENYGENAQRDGPNISLVLTDTIDVKFYYDHGTHWVTDNVNSIIATAPGSYQDEIGCPGDWMPDCLRSWLQDPAGDGIYSFTTTAIPPGNYEVKVAIDESWDENYGKGGVPDGPNIPFTVPEEGSEVSFVYDPETHLLTVTITEPTAVALSTISASTGRDSVLPLALAGFTLTLAAGSMAWRRYRAR